MHKLMLVGLRLYEKFGNQKTNRRLGNDGCSSRARSRDNGGNEHYLQHHTATSSERVKEKSLWRERAYADPLVLRLCGVQRRSGTIIDAAICNHFVDRPFPHHIRWKGIIQMNQALSGKVGISRHIKPNRTTCPA